MERRDWMLLTLAVIAGSFAADVDMHASEVQSTVLTLGVLGTLLGFARPQRWWLSGAALGATIPLTYLGAALLHVPVHYWPEPNIGAALLALVPALLATSLGSAAAKVGTVS